MSWANRRRLIIYVIIATVLIIPLSGLLFAVFYHVPSCSDKRQNQEEEGIDCGGTCAYLCTEMQFAPTVLFAKPLPGLSGRTDVVALIENKNSAAAAKDVPYVLSLYDADGATAGKATGTIDLPPGASVPVYITGATSGSQVVSTAFLTIDASQIRWYSARDVRRLPEVSNTTLRGTIDAPRIETTLTNSTEKVVTDITVIAIVFNVDGNVIAASRTFVSGIRPGGQATATFTWNTAFPGTPTAMHIFPQVSF